MCYKCDQGVDRSFLPPQPLEPTPSPNGVKVPGMNAEQLFDQALAKVESDSIRQWANSERNRPTWIKIAQLTVTNQNNPDVFRFSALIVATAIGL